MSRAATEFAFPLGTPAAVVFRAVWRTTLDAPGFAVLVPDAPLESRAARRFVVDLAAEFGRLAAAAGETPFVFERLGRFDQQVTTKFHRDGSPPASLLILAYEPTTVPSHLFVADAEAAARAAGVGVNAFLAANNPMFPPGESRLHGFITELDWLAARGGVVVLNNSLFPDDAPPDRPLGVLHKGEILRPDPAARRVINSAGIAPASAGRALPADAVERFLARDDLD